MAAISELPSVVLELMGNLYPKEGAHGKEHALQTAQLALAISHEPEYKHIINDRHRLLIATAALGHDLGYQQRQEYWSGTQHEHPYGSAEILGTMVDQVPNITPVEKATIGLLALNHDNTNYCFPAYQRFEVERNGFIEPVGFPPGPPPGILFEAYGFGDFFEEIDLQEFYPMLHILQEADSRLGDAQRTIDFSKSRNIPVAADDGGVCGIGMPMWQYSGLANVLLAAKRGLLDAYTQSGHEKAWQMFVKTRDFINQLIQQEPGYFPGNDNVGELLRYEDVKRLIWDLPPAERQKPWVRISQAFSLEGLSLISEEYRPQQRISSRLVDVRDLQITGGKIERTQTLKRIRELVIGNFAIDILTELSGALRIFAATESSEQEKEYTLIPPILNFMSNPMVKTGNNWVQLARELEIPKIRVLIIEN